MEVLCHECGKRMQFDVYEFRCSCGGAWELLEKSNFSKESIQKDNSSVWRYRDLFNLEVIKDPVTLGGGWTPLISENWEGAKVWFKLEYISPTGSFKDRGTEVEISHLRALGVTDVVEDSSGNAGAAVAAYSARAGLNAAIYAPDNVSPAKLAQIQIYGATLHKIPGPRINASRAVLQALDKGAVYASHAYNPIYLLGQQTFAWEVWEQMDEKVPDAVIIPVGQGGLLIGAWLGFRRLLNAGLIERLPRLFAVQPELFAPVFEAFSAGKDEVKEIGSEGKSIAEGLLIAKPVRGKRILQSLNESGGAALTVTELQINEAYHRLAEKGFCVEPSSAVAAAALPEIIRILGKDARIVAALTGSGLKSPPQL